MKNPKITFTTILFGLALACAAPAPNALGVVPPPDGCYPNFNTAEGCNALFSVTTGAANTAVGWFSLRGTTEGSFNTGLGAGTLLFKTTANGNTAVGAAALLFNIASNNTAVGAAALVNNIDGAVNNALGFQALSSHQTGSFNNAVGGFALAADQSGSFNNAFGDSALNSNVIGSNNTAVGDLALIGSTGDNNTALGAGAGISQDTGSNNIYIGDTGFAGENNVIAIGGEPTSGIDYTATYIGGIYDAVVTDRAVFVGSTGRLGTQASSQRYKEDIKPMDKASETLFALKPVVFRYKQEIDASRRLSFGLVAEEVAEISPDLVSHDKEGKPQTVRYEAVNAMLLNEFLKEHRKVEALETSVAQQRKKFQSQLEQQERQLKSLTAALQKVSAQLETRRSDPQIVANNR
jgi:hypothetical protein